MDSEHRRAIFGKLDELSQLSETELAGKFSNDNLSLVRDLMGELVRRIDDWGDLHRPDEFAKAIHHLREIKRTWSRNLGQLILESEETYRAGKTTEAMEMIDKFLDQCPSSFYREVAENHRYSLTG